MSIIKKTAVPHPGMYVLSEDISLDSTRKRAVGAGDPSARFVLGAAGSEVSSDLVKGLSNVEIKDQSVSVARSSRADAPEPETTGPVPSRSEGEPPVDVLVNPVDGPSATEGEPVDAGAGEPPAEKLPVEKHKRAGDR